MKLKQKQQSFILITYHNLLSISQITLHKQAIKQYNNFKYI